MPRAKVIVLFLPFVLLGTMLPVFRIGAAAFGNEAGYLLGFAFYWESGASARRWPFLDGKVLHRHGKSDLRYLPAKTGWR